MNEDCNSIKPKSNPISNMFHQLSSNKNILKSLVTKDLVGNYKNSYLGFAWHFVMPLLMLVVYYIAFGALNRSSIDNFWIYLGVGIFPFTFMVGNLTSGTGCISSNGNLINKIYFPREIIILAHVVSTFIVMSIGLLVVIVLICITGHAPPITVLPSILLLLVTMFIFVLGYVLLLSSLNVYVRDIQYFLNSIYVLFFFLTPMYFLAKDTSGILRTIVNINPFAYFVEGFHDALYWGVYSSARTYIVCTVLSVVSLIIGYLVFRKLKNGFAERL